MASNQPKMTPEMVDRVVAGLAAGESQRAVARALGVQPTTIGKLLRRDPDVVSRVKAEARRQRKNRARGDRHARAKAGAAKAVHDQAHDPDFTPPPAGSETRRIFDERLRIGDPAGDGSLHSADSLVRPPAPPPVPDDQATSPEHRPQVSAPTLPLEPRRRRPSIRFLSTYGTALMSPTDIELYARAGGTVLSGWDAPEPPPSWLDENERMLLARDPRGSRVYRIDPSLREEYERDGFVVT